MLLVKLPALKSCPSWRESFMNLRIIWIPTIVPADGNYRYITVQEDERESEEPSGRSGSNS